jgi:hypothetical protein
VQIKEFGSANFKGRNPQSNPLSNLFGTQRELIYWSKDRDRRDRLGPYLRAMWFGHTKCRITQAVVAARLGYPQSYISKCESGERRVDVIELTEFAKLYGRPLDFFVR